jgi:hypothetical protein
MYGRLTARNGFSSRRCLPVHRRDLEKPERADLLAEQRQSVGEEPRVTAAHPLHPDTGGAERRRRRLHAHAAHFVEQHHDIARRHEHVLFDLFPPEHLHAHRHVLDPLVGTCGRDRDLLFDGWRHLGFWRRRLLKVDRQQHESEPNHPFSIPRACASNRLEPPADS